MCWGGACSAWPTWLGVLYELHDLPGLGCCMQCMTYLAWGVGGLVGVVHDLPGLECWGDVCSAWPTWPGMLEDLLGCWGGAWPTWLGVMYAVHDLPGLGCWRTYLGVGVVHDLPGLGCCMQCMAWGVGGLIWVLGWCMTYLAWGVGVMYAVHDLPGLGCWRTYLGVGVVHDLPGLGCRGDVCSAWPTWPGVLEDLLGCWGGACSA